MKLNMTTFKWNFQLFFLDKTALNIAIQNENLEIVSILYNQPQIIITEEDEIYKK